MSNMKSYLAILMGVIIIVADLYWLSDSYTVPHWLYAGVAILVASVIWIYLDYSLMKK